jgi:hypothetical protein
MATFDWQECARISDLPLVDDAFIAFNDDATADNATGLVVTILENSLELVEHCIWIGGALIVCHAGEPGAFAIYRLKGTT